MIDEELRSILVCPACKGDLLYEETRIICQPCRKAYQHEWYLANREKCLGAGTARREAQRAERKPAPPPAWE